MHCLHDCEVVRQVWTSFGFTVPNFWLSSTFRSWVVVVPQARWGSFFILAWCIWRARCSLVFEGDPRSVQMVDGLAAPLLCVLDGGPSAHVARVPRWVT